MSKSKKDGVAPAVRFNPLVERVRRMCDCSSLSELFLRASMASTRKKLTFERAVSAYKRFLKDGRLVHWIRKVLHKVAQGVLKLPELEPDRA
jgi:hypothetical protein